MRPLRYSINVTLDGCCDHREGVPDEELHRHATETLRKADALLFGRVTYQNDGGSVSAGVDGRKARLDGTLPPHDRRSQEIRRVEHPPGRLERSEPDWHQLVRGDLAKAVQQLKQERGKGLLTGGVKLPLALAELGLIDEYEFVVQPRIAGHGPTLFAGLSKRVELKLVSRLEFASGAVALRYVPRR